MIRLLDVNVLVALAWPNHLHHGRARAWFRQVGEEGWATCSITETGFVRVSSNARVIPDAKTPQEALALLGRMRRMAGHAFWTDDVSPADPEALPFPRVVGHRQVTVAQLLALALRRGGCLATFDSGVRELAPPGTGGAVELIP